MLDLLIYFAKLSISFTAVYLFYWLFLRKLTFYKLHRFYFLLYTFASFFIAAVNVHPVVENKQWANWLPAFPSGNFNIPNYTISTPTEIRSTVASTDIWTILLYVVAAGMAVMMIRTLVQVFSLRKLLRQSTLLSNGKIKIYQVTENIMPFSFGNAVFINKNNHTDEELKDIVRHEFIHAKQAHSLDILWAELLCIINWFNPFVWMLRKAIRQNLEFIADEQVLQSGIEKKQYQYLLLKVIGNKHFSIASNFNFSSLKKRIAMMNKNKTARIHLARFLFLLPLVAILLLSFRNNVEKKNANQESPIIEKKRLIDDFSQTELNTIIDTPKFKKYEVLAKDSIVRITLPNGVVEKYDLHNEKQKKQLVKKYGDVPPPPPPMPPTPPAPPVLEKIPAPPQAPPAPPTPPQPMHKFTGLEGVISITSGNIEGYDITPTFTYINGKAHYYTQVENITTYYNAFGQKIDRSGNLLSTVQTNASEVLPNQYILKVYINGEPVSTFKDDKGKHSL